MQDVSECLSMLLDSVSEDVRSLQAEANIEVINPVVSNFNFTKDKMFDKRCNKHFAHIFSVLGVTAKQLSATQVSMYVKDNK